jgi:hypothetical protein
MKNFLLLFLLVNTSSFAQKIEWEFGEEKTGTHNDLKPLSILGTDDGTFVLRGNESGSLQRLSVEYFDDNKESQLFYVHYFDAAETDKVFFEGAATLDGKPYVFVSHFQNTNRKHNLYAYSIGKKSIDAIGKKELMSMPAFTNANCGSYTVRFSPDGTQFVVTQESPSDKTRNESISISGFDKTLSKLWTKDHTFDIPSRPMPVNVPYINDKGDVFIIKKDRDKDAYKYQVIMINQNGAHLSRQPVNLNGAFLSDIKAGITSNGQLAVCGFYSTANYFDYEGMFYFRYDAAGSIAGKHTEPLSADILGLFLGKKNATKPGAALVGFTLEHIVPTSDGGLYMLAEKTSQVTDKPGQEHYLFEDILVLAIDEHGNVKWGRQIRKKQESMNDGGKWSSYNYWTHEDTLHIIFNKVVIDEQLPKTGKKSKGDEFGDATFGGSTWNYIAPNGTIFNMPLLTLHKGHSVPLAVDTELLFVTYQEEVILLCQDYFSKVHRLLGITLKN